MISLLHIASIVIEFIVVIFGLLLTLKKKKSYGIFIALTFAIYVFYDTSSFISVSISKDTLYLIFFVATLSILNAVWILYKKGK